MLVDTPLLVSRSRPKEFQLHQPGELPKSKGKDIGMEDYARRK
jgi:hypothetical protein